MLCCIAGSQPLWCADLDVDIRWAGEPDVLLKLEPSNKWLLNAVKIGKHWHG